MVAKKKKKPRAVVETGSSMRGKAKVGSRVKSRVKTKRTSSKVTTKSKNLGEEKKRIAKKGGGAYITSKQEAPITKRTYELETKRKGSTKGYRKSGNKYYKTKTVVK